jgi:hypothetical protein
MITSSVSFGDATISLWDITGKLLIAKQIQSGQQLSYNLDLSGISKGSYLLGISGVNNAIIKHVVIQ